MPPTSSKPSGPPMSLGELVTCEDFLDGHRQYATDLLSNIEKLHAGHRANCPEWHQDQTCVLCGLCSAGGLMGATKKTLASYEDVGSHLKAVRASLGKCAPSRGMTGRETLFRNHLAKTIFLYIATVGDNLRLQHATWQARLQSKVTTPTSSDPSGQHISTSPNSADKNKNGVILLPDYSGPMFVNPEANPKLTGASTGLVPNTASDNSMFVIFRRCLSNECPCDANAVSHANLRDKMPEEYESRNSTSDTAWSTQAASRSSSLLPECEVLIVDPRISRLRTQIVQSDGVRGALMEWCRSWMIDLQTDPLERRGTQQIRQSRTDGMGGYPSTLVHETAALRMSPHAIHGVGESVTVELSNRGEKTDSEAREMQFEQEELKQRWLMARQGRGKYRKGHKVSV